MATKKEIKYIETDSGCWECISHSLNNGYPVRTVRSKLVYLHREAYEAAYGKIPSGYVVRHKCDNRKCINPKHLELGTAKDNVQDRVSRGRSAHGERMGNAVLTEAQAREIKSDHTKPTRILATKYSVSKTTIRDIRAGRRWIYINK